MAEPSAGNGCQQSLSLSSGVLPSVALITRSRSLCSDSLWSSLMRWTATNLLDRAEDEGTLPNLDLCFEESSLRSSEMACFKGGMKVASFNADGDFCWIPKVEATRISFVSYVLSITHRLSPTFEQYTRTGQLIVPAFPRSTSSSVSHLIMRELTVEPDSPTHL